MTMVVVSLYAQAHPSSRVNITLMIFFALYAAPVEQTTVQYLL
jgi:hypothetical protein